MFISIQADGKFEACTRGSSKLSLCAQAHRFWVGNSFDQCCRDRNRSLPIQLPIMLYPVNPSRLHCASLTNPTLPASKFQQQPPFAFTSPSPTQIPPARLISFLCSTLPFSFGRCSSTTSCQVSSHRTSCLKSQPESWDFFFVVLRRDQDVFPYTHNDGQADK